VSSTESVTGTVDVCCAIARINRPEGIGHRRSGRSVTKFGSVAGPQTGAIWAEVQSNAAVLWFGRDSRHAEWAECCGEPHVLLGSVDNLPVHVSFVWGSEIHHNRYNRNRWWFSHASSARRINGCNGLTAGMGCCRIDESDRSSERGDDKDWDTDTSVAEIVRLFFGCSDWDQG